MSNARLLIRNIADEGTLSSSPTAVSTLPVSNLQTQPRNEVWRSPDLSTQVISLVFSANQTASMVAVCRGNLTTGGTVRVQVYSDAAMTSQISDSTALAAFSTSGFADVDAWRYLTDSFRGKKNFVYYFGRLTNVQGVKITITDASNPDGYMQYSRLFVGDYFEFTYQVADEAESGSAGAMTVQGRSDGGDLWSDRGPGFEVQHLDIGNIHENDVPSVLALAEYLERHTDFWFDLMPGDTSAFAVYRRGQRKFTDLGPLQPRGYQLNQQTLSMEAP